MTMCGADELDSAIAAVWSLLKCVPDPCHALSGHDLSIVDLGLVNDVVREGDALRISVTFTDPSCVFSYQIIMDLEDLAETLDGVSEITVTSDPYPLWTEDRLSDKARKVFADKRQRFGVAEVTQPNQERHQ
ncbi:MAG: iron-sulfur cluster assembly protein [Rhodospirillaceae bacterium]